METSQAAIWKPNSDRITSSRMYSFLRETSAKRGFLPDWNHLYQWSIQQPEEFWSDAADFTKVIWHKRESEVLSGDSMFGARWFPESQLNYAENLLSPIKYSAQPVLISYVEGAERRTWTGQELWNDVSRLATWFKSLRIAPGDRIAGVLVNGPEAVIAMLAATSVGAIWSSCSPDFGVSGILDRFSQIEPKILFITSAYLYNGKRIEPIHGVREISGSLPSLVQTVAVEHLEARNQGFESPTLSSILQNPSGAKDSEGYLPLTFEPMDFGAPLYILYSSGTTGKPKCIVHSVGGTLLQHKKELSLHTDLGAGDKLFYFTTCGWMMWNWMVSALSVGASIVTYDGAVVLESNDILWRMVEQEKVNVFGTSPKFISSCMKASYIPHYSFSHLKTILSTGSPLPSESYAWVYDHVKQNVQIASISGGTDIISCFMLGNPLLEVHPGEIQSAGLGMAIESWNDDGQRVQGVKAELVCVKPFPSMPIGFWNDPSGEKYREAYFSYFKNRQVWRQGDWVSIQDHGSVIVYGRSDTTLNPGGVRIGTAEIYRQTESFPEIQDSIVVGVPKGDDVMVSLFIKLVNDVDVDDLKTRIKQRIRAELTPRHVPERIYVVSDIPYTRSGKKVELAVLNAILGLPIGNADALMNPEALKEYMGILGKA
ncbi:MAG: acetoacetate--CoA ligase [Pseudomonadota bacterium]